MTELTDLTCADVHEREYAALYAADRLGDAELKAFESHFLLCERCQRELRMAATLRRMSMQPHLSIASRPAKRRRTYWVLGAAVAGLVVAAVLGSFTRRAALSDLGEVIEPPIYLGVRVRERRPAGDSLFASAMGEYADRRYATAADQLGQSLVAGADSAPALFFRAASWLMTGRARDAAAAFAAVEALGDTPYSDEARFFQAKALLRLGQDDAALAALRRVDAGSDMSAPARALADSIALRLRR